MSLLEELRAIHAEHREPFLIDGPRTVSFTDVAERDLSILDSVVPGDVVAVIGTFSTDSIAALMHLFDKGAIVVPLAPESAPQHDYFFEVGCVDLVYDGVTLRRLRDQRDPHPLLEELRGRGHAGLVLFSSGTTGRPKAILHDFDHFVRRFRTPRPALRTLNFLLFDHIGGINTLFHTIFNKGLVVVPSARTPEGVLSTIAAYNVELLPTTPTFLRMLLAGGLTAEQMPKCLKIITYGTERMDQPTLNRLCERFPWIQFRQTFGMSELGILRVKSEASNSLWMKVGGDGVETRIAENGVLMIRSATRMLGYLNAPSPFTDGWYDTGDIVETKEGGYIRVVGRSKEIINIGGIKVLPSEIERVGLEHPQVLRCLARGVANPLTGQHIEVLCQLRDGAEVTRTELRDHFRANLPQTIWPHRITIGDVSVNHRFKQMG